MTDILIKIMREHEKSAWKAIERLHKFYRKQLEFKDAEIKRLNTLLREREYDE